MIIITFFTLERERGEGGRKGEGIGLFHYE